MLAGVRNEAPPGSASPVARDAADFDAFYAASSVRLVRQLHAMTGERGVAQDCVQEAFARAWQHWPRVRSYDAPEARVRSVAWKLAVSRFRRTRTARRALRRDGVPPDVPALSPDRVALVAALAQLPDVQRRAVVLHHVADLSVEQVAAETGAPTGTVKARLVRGRARLAELLADEPASRSRRAPPVAEHDDHLDARLAGLADGPAPEL